MKQLTDDYVSYEIAQLLKEKGFNGDCDYWYGEYGERCCSPSVISVECWCPSQSLALKWLREVHGLHIKIDYTKNHYGNLKSGYFFSIVGINSDYDYCQSCLDDIFEEPEQAVEAALFYVLKNLIY